MLIDFKILFYFFNNEKIISNEINALFLLKNAIKNDLKSNSKRSNEYLSMFIYKKIFP